MIARADPAARLPSREVEAGVRDALFDYCRFVDEGDAAGFAEAFTRDCLFEDGRGRIEGRAAMRHFVGKVIDRYQATSHHLSNIRMEMMADGRVRATSYIYAWHLAPDGAVLEVWGRYTDDLKEEEGRWRIAHRRLEVAGLRGMPDPGFAKVPRSTKP